MGEVTKNLILKTFIDLKCQTLRTEEIRYHIKTNYGARTVVLYQALWDLESEGRVVRHTKFLNSHGRICVSWFANI